MQKTWKRIHEKPRSRIYKENRWIRRWADEWRVQAVIKTAPARTKVIAEQICLWTAEFRLNSRTILCIVQQNFKIEDNEFFTAATRIVKTKARQVWFIIDCVGLQKKNDHCFFFSNPRFVLNILFRNTRMVFSCNFAAQIMTPAYGPLSNLHCI